MIAALFVEYGGVYFDLPNVKPYTIYNDARQYDGPWPVVAHPPCARWGRLAFVNRARYGTPVGEDGGLFEFALMAVRKWGGVIEHPQDSRAWPKYGLPTPGKTRWNRGKCGGYSAQVYQRHYGHRANKCTWLYSYGCVLPELKWGKPEGKPSAQISCIGLVESMTVELMGKRERARTPIAFRDLLISMAESVTSDRLRGLVTDRETR